MTLSLSPNATVVLEKRYLKKDPNGIPVETPEALFQRVARSVAAADKLFDSAANIGKTEKSF